MPEYTEMYKASSLVGDHIGKTPEMDNSEERLLYYILIIIAVEKNYKMRFKWTDEKIQYLKDNYSVMSPEELVKALGLNNTGVLYSKASDLKIKREGYRYTKEEEDFIRENFSNMSSSELAIALNRSESQIYCKTSNMGLKSKLLWTEEEIELLKENYSKYSNKYLSENVFIGRNAESIRTMAFKFGLKTERSYKQFDEGEIIDKLKKIYQETGRTPISIEFEKFGLPSARTVARYFGGYEELCKIAEIPPNISMDGSIGKKQIASDGTICMSKSELIVTEYFISNNIPYEKEVPYKRYMPEEECKNKRFDWLANGKLIEFFGLKGLDFYDKKIKEKRRLCEKYNIELVELYRNDLTKLQNKI